MKNGYEYIEELQREYLNTQEGLIRWDNVKKSFDNKDFIKQIQKSNSIDKTELEWILECFKHPMPTKYEDPRIYPILKENFDSIIETFQVIQTNPSDVHFFKKDYVPAVGILPLKSLNGYYQRIKGQNEYVLLFSHGLFKFSLVISRIFIDLITDRKEGLLNFNEISREKILQRFNRNKMKYMSDINELKDLFLVYEFGDLFRDKFIPYQNRITRQISNSIVKFVIAHELTHFYKEHQDFYNIVLPTKTEEYRNDLDVNYEMETEADKIGSIVLIKNLEMNGIPVHIGLIGISLFYAMLIMFIGNKTSLTHPPSLRRYENIRNALVSLYPNNNNLIKNGLEIGDTLFEIILNNHEKN